MKPWEAIFLLHQMMIIYWEKMWNKTFKEKKTKLKSNSLRKLDDTKPNMAHKRRQKRKRG